MPVSAISIEPLAGSIGALVRGVDCRAIDDELAERLRAAWHTYRLLIFRDVVRSDDDLVDLGHVFGEIMPSRQKSPLTSRPEIMVISNIRVAGKVAGVLPDGEMEWHYDGMHQQQPYTGGILYCLAMPKHGGETAFADMRRAYAALPAELKARLEGLTAHSSYDYNSNAAKVKAVEGDAPRAVHPVVREIPETGEKAIFVAKLMTDRILEVDEAESAAILGRLYAEMERPEYAYVHTWHVGDAVLWDNRCIVHARRDFDAAEERLLKRVTIL